MVVDMVVGGPQYLEDPVDLVVVQLVIQVILKLVEVLLNQD